MLVSTDTASIQLYFDHFIVHQSDAPIKPAHFGLGLPGGVTLKIVLPIPVAADEALNTVPLTSSNQETRR